MQQRRWACQPHLVLGNHDPWWCQCP
jgi:hypothetical protein